MDKDEKKIKLTMRIVLADTGGNVLFDSGEKEVEGSAEFVLEDIVIPESFRERPAVHIGLGEAKKSDDS